MQRKTGKAMAAAAGMLVAAASWAGAPNPMAPGQWETTREMTINGAAQPVATSSACLDKARVDGFALYEPSSKPAVADAVSCEVRGYSFAAGKATWKTVCKMRDGSSATVAVANSATKTSAEFASTFDAGDEKGEFKRSMSVRLAMRRTGDCAPK